MALIKYLKSVINSLAVDEQDLRDLVRNQEVATTKERDMYLNALRKLHHAAFDALRQPENEIDAQEQFSRLNDACADVENLLPEFKPGETN